MSPIILIGMPEDEPRIRTVVEALHGEGVELWWERAVPGDMRWERTSQTVLEARCAVFFWTAASIGASADAAAYRLLARRARTSDKLISARLARVAIPEEFSGSTVIDLAGWRAGAKDVFLLDLAAAAKAKAAGLDPPPERGPLRRLVRRAALFGTAILIPLGILANIFGVYQGSGLDRIASAAEARDWAALKPGSCGDLRAFIATHSDGARTAEAQGLLSARTVSIETDWRPVEKPLPLYLARGMADARASETAARTLATDRATEQSAGECQAYALAGLFRLQGARFTVDRWLCEPLGGGIVCGLEGKTQCALLEKSEIEREQCGASAP